MNEGIYRGEIVPTPGGFAVVFKRLPISREIGPQEVRVECPASAEEAEAFLQRFFTASAEPIQTFTFHATSASG